MKRTVWLWLILVSALAGCLIKLGVPVGKFHWHQFRYFTTLSNLLAALYCVYALLRGRSGVSPLFRGMVLMALLVTGIVYHLLLSDVFGGATPFSMNWWGNHLVHTITPLLMAAEWLLVREGTALTWYHPLVWALFPLAYMGVTVAVAKMGICFPYSNTPYPYPFLDVWALGWGPVLRNAALLVTGFMALGYGLVGLDRLGR